MPSRFLGSVILKQVSKYEFKKLARHHRNPSRRFQSTKTCFHLLGVNKAGKSSSRVFSFWVLDSGSAQMPRSAMNSWVPAVALCQPAASWDYSVPLRWAIDTEDFENAQQGRNGCYYQCSCREIDRHLGRPVPAGLENAVQGPEAQFRAEGNRQRNMQKSDGQNFSEVRALIYYFPI